MDDRPRSNDDTRPAGPVSEATQSPELVSLIAQCVERVEQEGSSALVSFCGEYPEHAKELRRVVGELLASGMIDTGAADDRFPDQLGGFRLIERIGVGGMGVVFRAEQESLGRQVALKLIRPDYLFFPGARDRLRREVEAVARLDHPGIVSILTVGEEGDIPYFAMEFVHGCSLAEALNDLQETDYLTGKDLHDVVVRLSGDHPSEQDSAFGLPSLYEGTYSQACTRIARQVAEALQHAHERGIIHRDVKPQNIMLTPDGRVLVVDFGLALLQEAPKLTRSGQAPGSAAYMAPEQITGDAQDERIDIYALGVSLYEALTLRLPFSGQNVAEIHHQVLEGEPASLRAHSSTVSRDLETVCLTAMSRPRTSRYSSAAALARDLTNVLELRPVLARRPGLFLRTVRWTQRHKAATVAIVLGVLLMVGIPLTLWWQERQSAQEIQLALDEAKDNFDRSLRAVDQLLAHVSEERLKHVPRMTEVRWELIALALKHYEELVAKHPDHLRLVRRTAKTQIDFATQSILRGKHQDAERALKRGMQLWEQLIARSQSPADLEQFANALVEHGAVRLQAESEKTLSQGGSFAEVLETAGRIQSILDRLPGAETSKNRRRLRANAFKMKALALDALGRRKERDAQMVEAVARFRQLHKDSPEDHDAAMDMGRTLFNLGGQRERDGLPGEAATSYSEAVTILEKTIKARPEHEDGPYVLLRALNALARLNAARRRNDKAEEVSRRAAKLGDKLVEDFPHQPNFAIWCSWSHQNLGLALFNQKQPDEALLCFETAIRAAARAAQLSPDSEEAKKTLFNHHVMRCAALAQLGDHRNLRKGARTLTEIRQDQEAFERAAVMTAGAALLVRRDHTLRGSERDKLYEEYVLDVEGYLDKAVDAGLRNPGRLNAPVFHGLGDRPGFERLREKINKLRKDG